MNHDARGIRIRRSSCYIFQFAFKELKEAKKYVVQNSRFLALNRL
jgi:hypothetical protein